MNEDILSTVGTSGATLVEAHSRCPTRVVKVLHVINGEHYSGAERVQDLLALRLPEFGYDVGFACVKPDKFLRSRQSQDAALHETPMTSKFDIRIARTLAKLVREQGYELIHAHTPRTAMVGRIAAAWAKVPLVYHVHSPTSRDSTRGFTNRVNNWIERASVGGAAKLICVSHSLGRHMLGEGFSASRIAVVPNGVPAVENVLPRATPTGEWTIGTVALFRQRKGTEVLIDALAILRELDLPARLRCVGGFETTEYENELKRRVAQHELEAYVDWTGFTRNVNAELNRMDLFALPSLFGEGLPMVVLEAMATGIPVVATDVEGVPEAIRNGVDGVIARAKDADDLAQQIARVMRGELNWQRLRTSALERQRAMFSDASMAAGVAKVYDELT